MKKNKILELRKKTKASLSRCKEVLELNEYNIIEAEQVLLREMQNPKRRNAILSREGMITVKCDQDKALILETKCETDFVARSDAFINFSKETAESIFAYDKEFISLSDVSCLYSGGDVGQALNLIISQTKENVLIGRLVKLNAGEEKLCSYVHDNKIGVIIKYSGDDGMLAKQICLQIAAMRPEFIDESQVTEELMSKITNKILEENIETEKSHDIDKRLQGQIRQYISQKVLAEQKFIYNHKLKVSQILNEKKTRISKFFRIEVGK